MWSIAQGLNLKPGSAFFKLSSVVEPPQELPDFLLIKPYSQPLVGKQHKLAHCVLHQLLQRRKLPCLQDLSEKHRFCQNINLHLFT